VHDCGSSYLGGRGRRISVWPIPYKKYETIFEKQIKKQKDWGVSQVVECLPSKPEALNSIPSTAKNTEFLSLSSRPPLWGLSPLIPHCPYSPLLPSLGSFFTVLWMQKSSVSPQSFTLMDPLPSKHFSPIPNPTQLNKYCQAPAACHCFSCWGDRVRHTDKALALWHPSQWVSSLPHSFLFPNTTNVPDIFHPLPCFVSIPSSATICCDISTFAVSFLTRMSDLGGQGECLFLIASFY
jgi:hypothetical protein